MQQSELSENAAKKSVYLDIIPVRVIGKKAVLHAYALLDFESDRTFCERQLVDKLSLNSHRFAVKLAIRTMMNKEPELLESSVVSFDIHSLDSSYSLNLPEVLVAKIFLWAR